ncbi:unnamed protein product [Trichobilharzia szidati]|nr:unnamed protein product [Trichobilharzia szidati]
MKCETMKKMNYLYGFENANFHTPSPRSSLLRRRSSKSSMKNFENKNNSQKPNDEKTNEFQRTSRQMTTAKKTHKDLSPPKILLDNIPPESSYVAKKVDSLKDTQKNSSSDKENESNSTVGRSSKVNVPTSNRLPVSSKRLLSAAGERKAESRINGPFTIQFIMSSPACVEKGWTNENILVSFMNTMEWAHSRLTNAMKKNKADYYYEDLQFVHYCQPQYITYSSMLGVKRLKLLSLTHLTSTNDPTLTNNANKCMTGDVTTDKKISVGSEDFVENKVKLLFKIGFDKVKEERLPAMKIYQIMSSTSVPSLTSIQPYRNLFMEEFERHVMDNMTLLTIANLNVIKQVEMISRNIVKVNDKKDVSNNSEATLKLCMKKMASVLQSQQKSMKQIENTKVEQSHPWFSYSSDGTLTVRYPCGSPAIIWSSSPLLFHQSYTNIHSHDSSSVNRVKASDTKIKNIKETNPSIFTQRSNTNISSTHSGGGVSLNSANLLSKRKMTSKRENAKQRTGFYLTLFDMPLNEEGRKLDGNSHKFDPQFLTSSNMGHDLMSVSEKESNLNLDPTQKSRNAIRRPSSMRDNISSSCSMHSGSNQSEMHSEQLKSDDRQSHNEDIYTENLATGPLIGQFTPTGEGVIYYPYNSDNSDVAATTTMKSNNDNRTKRLPINIHAIFTKDYCYVFNKSTGDLDYQFPRVSNKTLHDPTIRFPISLDISFNQYIRCIYTNCNDLTVIFNTQNNILLNIDCFQNLYTFEEENDGEVLTSTEDGGLKQCQQPQYVLSKLPFLSSIVDASSQNKQLLTSRRRKEEGLQKIFKQIPPIGDLHTLSSHLQESKKRISFLCDQWLEIVRFSLGLQRYRIPSPTSSRHLLRYKSMDRITKRFKTFTNMSGSFQNNDENDSKPSNKSNTPNVNNQLNTGKKPIKSIDFHSERNDNRRDTIHKNELNKKPTVEKDYKLSEEELPVVESILMRSLTTVDRSYSIAKEANIFPVACPVLLRLWLDEIKKDKYFKYLKKNEQIINKIPLKSSCCLDNDSKLLTKAFMEVLYTPSKFSDSLLSNLATISSRGCRCSRQIPPDITDLEFELFLNKLLPSYQAAVIMVYDSR